MLAHWQLRTVNQKWRETLGLIKGSECVTVGTSVTLDCASSVSQIFAHHKIEHILGNQMCGTYTL